MRPLLATLAALLATPAATSANPPQPLTFQNGSPYRIQSPLDQQGGWPSDPDPATWVFNPTGCAWNDQDDVLREGRGDLDGTVSDRLCLIANLDETFSSVYPHSVYVHVYAPHDTLTVSLANDAGDSWQAGPSVPWGNERLWRLCVKDPIADRANSRDFSIWPEVPGTNGGRGQRVTYTLTVTTVGRRTRGVVAYWEIAGSGPTWQAPRTITNCL